MHLLSFKCFPMFVQTCEKVAVIIRVENNWQSVASSLIMLPEEIKNNMVKKAAVLNHVITLYYCKYIHILTVLICPLLAFLLAERSQLSVHGLLNLWSRLLKTKLYVVIFNS